MQASWPSVVGGVGAMEQMVKLLLGTQDGKHSWQRLMINGVVLSVALLLILEQLTYAWRR